MAYAPLGAMGISKYINSCCMRPVTVATGGLCVCRRRQHSRTSLCASEEEYCCPNHTLNNSVCYRESHKPGPADRQTDNFRERERGGGRKGDGERVREEREREREGEQKREGVWREEGRGRKGYRQTDRQTNRQIVRQIERDREEERERRERERERERERGRGMVVKQNEPNLSNTF